MRFQTFLIAGVSGLVGFCLAILNRLNWTSQLWSDPQIARAAAAFLGLFLGIMTACYLGLLGVAAWKIVTGKLQGPKNCPHCDATLRA